MKAKVYLNQPLTQDRYGLHFEKGEALCENEYIIQKLQKKGVKVEIIEEKQEEIVQNNSKEKTVDEITIAELRKYATENNIKIPSKVKNKTDIIEFINNYKKDDEEQKDLQTNNDEGNPNTNSESPEGEENINTEPTGE